MEKKNLCTVSKIQSRKEEWNDETGGEGTHKDKKERGKERKKERKSIEELDIGKGSKGVKELTRNLM